MAESGSSQMADTPLATTDRIAFVLAVGFGSGLIKKAPGTWGSLGALVIISPIVLFVPSPFVHWVLWSLVMMSLVLGLWACGPACRQLGLKDPGAVVIDEFAGLWLTVALLPGIFFTSQAYLALCLSFIFFRFFDIVKPWPIPWFERLGGAVGIMVDDLIAGCLAGLVTAAVLFGLAVP